MTAEEKWKNDVEINIQKVHDDVANVSKEIEDLKLMPGQLTHFVETTKIELRAEIENAIEGVVARLTPTDDVSHHRVLTNSATFFQKPPKYKEGEDPETFVAYYELLARGNKWNHREMAERLPTYLPLSMLSWYLQLNDGIKTDFNNLKEAFVSRYDLNRDKQQLLIEYHDLRAKQFATLDEYAARVQNIGQKLGKSPQDNLMQFKLGLPIPTFKWIQERNPQTLEKALRLAMDFMAMFGGSMKASLSLLPEYVPNDGRQVEPMEHRMRATPAQANGGNRNGYPYRTRTFSSRDNNDRCSYRPPSNAGGRGANASASNRNEGPGPRMPYPSAPSQQQRQNNSGRDYHDRQPRVNQYQLEDEAADHVESSVDHYQSDVNFTAEWFRCLPGNDDHPVTPQQ